MKESLIPWCMILPVICRRTGERIKAGQHRNMQRNAEDYIAFFFPSRTINDSWTVRKYRLYRRVRQMTQYKSSTAAKLQFYSIAPQRSYISGSLTHAVATVPLLLGALSNALTTCSATSSCTVLVGCNPSAQKYWSLLTPHSGRNNFVSLELPFHQLSSSYIRQQPLLS